MAEDTIASLGTFGVYEIRNCVSGTVYVGSTCNLAMRRLSHFNALKRGKHHCRHLQNAWMKYGEGAFAFAHVASVASLDDLLHVEQIITDARRSAGRVYNVASVAGSTRGTVRTQRSKDLISAANRAVWADPQKRLEHSRLLAGKKRKPLESAHKEKISRRAKGSWACSDYKARVSDAMRRAWSAHEGLPHLTRPGLATRESRLRHLAFLATDEAQLARRRAAQRNGAAKRLGFMDDQTLVSCLLKMQSDGLSNREIGRQLGISHTKVSARINESTKS